MALTTDKFLGLSENSAVTQGLPDARIVSVPHPIGATPEDDLRRRAEQVADESIALLTGSARNKTNARSQAGKE